MIFDSDVLVWALRGSDKAAQAITNATDRQISVVTYMELLQGARDKAEIRDIKSFLRHFSFMTFPLTENISHRASIYLEEYTLSHSLGMPDALIAATAVERNLPLQTGNSKHYKVIKELDLHPFRP